MPCSCSPTLVCTHTRKLDLFEVVDGIKEALSTTSPISKDGIYQKRSQKEHDELSVKLTRLLEDLDLSLGELSRYAHFCNSKKYTRNLIASDKNFTLMLLCWTPGKESPIHDHPCEGCWMRVCTGRIRETVYQRHASSNSLSELKSRAGNAGDVLYVDDSIGLHKVGSETIRNLNIQEKNKNLQQQMEGKIDIKSTDMKADDSDKLDQDALVFQITEDAKGQPLQEGASITLHLYSPPFLSCSVWLSEDAALDAPCKPIITYHSEFGELIDDANIQPNALTGGEKDASSTEPCDAQSLISYLSLPISEVRISEKLY